MITIEKSYYEFLLSTGVYPVEPERIGKDFFIIPDHKYKYQLEPEGRRKSKKRDKLLKELEMIKKQAKEIEERNKNTNEQNN